MVRKVIDIIGPTSAFEEKGVEENKNKEIEDFSVQRFSTAEARLKKRESAKRKKGFVWTMIFAGIFVLVTAGWLIGIFYPKLTLRLYPQIEKQSFEEEVEVNAVQLYLDQENKILPGRFFEGEAEENMTFKTQGREVWDEKARGTIKIYNSCQPPRSITLREGTRFLSSEGGKIFRTVERVVLAPAQNEGGKLVPSVKEVAVIAQEGGDEYNIGPSKFSIPGFAGSTFYYTIWAESEKPMTGGFKKEVEVIKKEDLAIAEESLKKALLKKAKSLLETQLPADFVLDEGALVIEDFQKNCTTQEGEKVPQFSCQGKIKVKGLAFNLTELKNLALNCLVGKLDPEKDFDRQNLSFEFSPKSLVSETGKMLLGVKIKINSYPKIHPENILAQVGGKSEEEIKGILFEQYPFLQEAKVVFWPFWAKKAPKDKERIKVELGF